jgi:hypothetical protein
MGGPYEGEVSIELEGRTYAGNYRVDDKGMLHVSYGADSNSARHRGPESPKPLAKMLLRELVGRARKDGGA